MRKLIESPVKVFKYLFLLLVLILTVYPMYWMIYGGTMDSSQLVKFLFSLIPGNNIDENYELINASFNVGRVFFNTFFVAVIGTLLSLSVNLLMGYALAKFDFKFKKAFFNVFVVTMFMGGAAAMIPQFEIIMKLNLYNSLFAIILPGVYSTYTVFLARQTLMDFPTEIIQSGRIDGCGELKIFWSLVVPNCKAIIATISIITFMNYWNGYLWNLIVTSSVDKYTLQVALAAIYPKSAMWTYAPVKMLGATISIVPILILFISMQKYFINSITGAVKG
ncbi:MAG: L-arabinose transporter permease AraQ [Eubacterium sp.]|jgi:ABC-type glycerol-3-phosphate transport system permease component|nr:L-arabinose transporter permease AraQ [Eubacterium sp.]